MSLSTGHEETDRPGVAALCAAAERNDTGHYAMAGTVLGVNDVGPMLLYTDPDDMDPRPRCLTGEDLPGLIFTEGPGIIRSKNYELHVGQKNTDPIDMWKKGGGYQEAKNWVANSVEYTITYGTGSMVRGGTDRHFRYKFFYLDVEPRITVYVLGVEYQQRSPAKRSPGLQRTMSRAADIPMAPKKIRVTRSPAATYKQLTVMRPKIETGLQPLGAAADVCPGGVKEDETESIQKLLEIQDAEQLEGADDSLSDDEVEGLPLDQHALPVPHDADGHYW